MNRYNSLISQLYILVTIGRQRPSVCCASSLLSVAKDGRQPVSTNRDDGNSAVFQHQQVFRSRCGGRIPFAPSEADLCHFYQDIAHILEDEHL